MGTVHGQRGMLGIRWRSSQSERFCSSALCLSVKRKHTSQLSIHYKPLVHHSCAQHPLQEMTKPLCNACPCCLHNSCLMGWVGKSRVRKIFGSWCFRSGWLLFPLTKPSNAAQDAACKCSAQLVWSRQCPLMQFQARVPGWACSLWKEESVLYKHLTPGKVSARASHGWWWKTSYTTSHIKQSSTPGKSCGNCSTCSLHIACTPTL